MLISAVLNAAGHDVVTAKDFVEAQAKFKGNNFALVITDWQYPGAQAGKADGGRQLIGSIRQGSNNAAVPILIISSSESTVRSAIAAEPALFAGIEMMTKPVKIEDLKRKV